MSDVIDSRPAQRFNAVEKISAKYCEKTLTIHATWHDCLALTAILVNFADMNLRIFPPDELLQADVRLPLSKSVSARALILDALAGGDASGFEVAACDDTDAMRAALADPSLEYVNIGAAGTAMRFLTAYFAAQPGRTVRLDGSERMRRRPVAPLVEALRSCGASVDYVGEEGFPPLLIRGRRLDGGSVSIDSTISSQFISALLMIAPTMSRGLRLTLVGEPASEPYMAMTLDMMRRWGAVIDRQAEVIEVAPATYRTPGGFEVEADWSAASYWYEIEALTSGWLTLRGLTDAAHSLQGDSRCASLFVGLGVETEPEGESGGTDLVASPDVTPRFVADMSDTPDIVQTVAVSCAMLGVPFRLTGVASLRIKETDRIEALRRELLKVGVIMETEGDDCIFWESARRPVTEVPVFDTYDDHRMAMAFAPVAIYIPGTVVRDAGVVAKSYPGFWDDLREAGFTVEELPEEPAE